MAIEFRVAHHPFSAQSTPALSLSSQEKCPHRATDTFLAEKVIDIVTFPLASPPCNNCQIWPLLPSWKGFPGGSDGKASACNVGDLGSTPGSGRSPGEGNGNPLQYSCLENSMDGGAWWATVHGVTKNRTRLSNFTSLHFLPENSPRPCHLYYSKSRHRIWRQILWDQPLIPFLLTVKSWISHPSKPRFLPLSNNLCKIHSLEPFNTS